MGRLFTAACFFLSLLCTQQLQAQNATPAISIGLLQAPTAHDCPGIVRIIQSSCGCGYANSGWSVFWAPAPGNTAPSPSSGSITWPQSYGTCGNQDTSNVALNPGDYIFTATISPDMAGCHGLNETRTFSISIPANLPCIPPVLHVTGTTQETGFGCNNGTLSFSGSITQCAGTAIIFQLYDSANNLIRTVTRTIYSYEGMQGTFGGLGAGTYTLKAYQPPGISPCPNEVKAEQSVSISTVPVQVNGDANLITETGDGGCQRHKIICTYSDDFVQRACGTGPTYWTATLRGTTAGGQDIFLEGLAMMGDSETFLDIPPGEYTVNCSRSLPGPTQGNTESSISIPGSSCSSTLSHTIISTQPGKGFGCDSAAIVEFTFTSDVCYHNWTLYQPDMLSLPDGGGTWSAPKGEKIRVAVPASSVAGTGFTYLFIAENDADRFNECRASDNVTGVPSLGCDASVSGFIYKPVSVPGAEDGVYAFTLQTSSCLDAPWFVVMKHVTTGVEYGGSADSKNDSLFVYDLPAGNYTYSFEFAGAGACGNPGTGGGGSGSGAGGGSLDCTPTTVYQDNDGDGLGNPAVSALACSPTSLPGYTGNNLDMNDNMVTYADNDGDGFGFGNPAPSGVTNNLDCDDSHSTVYPGAPEICDGLDNNCDGYTDVLRSEFTTGLVAYYPFTGNANDAIGTNNGTVDGAILVPDRFANANSAYSFDGIDDAIDFGTWFTLQNFTISMWINPAASQNTYADIIDNNHSGSFTNWTCQQDAGNTNQYGFGTMNTGVSFTLTSGSWQQLTLVKGTNTLAAYINGVLVQQVPYSNGAINYNSNFLRLARWGGGGRNWKGQIDELKIFNFALSPTQVFENYDLVNTSIRTFYYQDADGDGFGNPAVSQLACSQPPGYVLNDTDCDDSRSAVYPGAVEICDGLDNDCNGLADSVFVSAGFVCATANEGGSLTLTAPAGLVFSSVDFASYGNPTGSCGNFAIGSCHASNSLSVVQEMVIGQNSITIPANNALFGDPCAGVAKRLFVQVNYTQKQAMSSMYYADADGDGFGNPAVSQLACSQPSGYVLNYSDCDDTRSTVYPGAPEICDGLDNNCDGMIETTYPTTGLVAYYPFNGNADDAVGSFNGTVTGATLSTDRFGNANRAYHFNGINQSISAPPATTVTDNFAMTGWARVDNYSTGLQILFCNGNSSSSGWGLLVDHTGKIYVIYGGVILSGTSGQIPLQTWKHVALTRVSGTTLVYVDGAQVFNSAIPAPSPVTSNLTIGVNNLGTEYFNGSLDDIKIYNASLSALQVKQDYNAGVQSVFYRDADGDGFGSPSVTTMVNCGSPAPTGYISNNTDCDDNNSNINPNASAGVLSGLSVLCAGQSAPFSSNGTAGGAWLSRNSNVFTVNGGGVVTAVANGSAYLVYTVNNCSVNGSADSVLVTVASQYVWTGAGANRNWNNAANWTACGIPPNGADVTISDVPNQPLLNVDAVTGNIILNGNAALAVGEKTLTVNAALTGTGSLSVSPASSLVIAGSAGTVKFTAAKDTVGNLTIALNASATLGSMLYVKAGTVPGVVSLQQGAVLNANGNLTLLSDINGTARVAQLPVNGSGAALAAIHGDVTIERFIPKNLYKAWHMLSVPTRGTQTIKQAWQENRNAGVVGIAGYGTTITTASGFLQNGFDAVTAKTSIQSFNPGSGGLVNLTSTLNPAETRNGYFIYVRGDRTVPVNGNTAAVNATRLRTRGTLYTGNQPALSSGAANRYLMVAISILPPSISPSCRKRVALVIRTTSGIPN